MQVGETPMEYRVKNIHQYIRKSFKSLRGLEDGQELRPPEPAPEPVQRDLGTTGTVPDDYDNDPERELDNILHKKCAVITLAEEQLHRLMEDVVDQSMDDASRSLFAYYKYYRYRLTHGNLKKIVLLLTIIGTFFFGLLLGSASCGTYQGRFNSPLLNCINEKFINDDYLDIDNVFIGIA